MKSGAKKILNQLKLSDFYLTLNLFLITDRFYSKLILLDSYVFR